MEMKTIIRKIKTGILHSTLVVIFLTLAPPPFAYDLNPEPFMTSAPVLEGPLAPNDLLESTEKLYDGLVTNPECIDVLKGALYTGLEDGRIVKLQDNKITTVFRSGGDDCDKVPRGCGRPNGIKFDRNGELVVADPLVGVYRVNVETGGNTSLFSIETTVDGLTANLCNHPDVGKNGDVFFSDVSTKRNMYSNYYEFVEVAPNGRVLHYNSQTKETKTLVDKLYFPNGVQLSPDESFLIIAQSAKYNILKYHLRGEKQGQLEMFVDNLPGIPDNIHSSGRGTFWVGLVSARIGDQLPILERLGPYPMTRKLIGRIIHASSFILNFLADTIPLNVLTVLRNMMEAKKLELMTGPHYGLVLEIDTNGRIVRSLHSPSGHVHLISHALEHENFLYLGTPFGNYVGKVQLPSVEKN